MNIELLKQIRDAIEVEPMLYDQADWGWHYNETSNQTDMTIACHTPGCIAGHALHLANIPYVPGEDVSTKAEKVLYISLKESALLFCATWDKRWLQNMDTPLPMVGYNDFEPTPTDAINILDRLIKHGFEKEENDA